MRTLGDILEDNKKLADTFFSKAEAFIAKRKKEDMKTDYCKCTKPKYIGDCEEGYYCDTCELEIGEDKLADCEDSFAGENEWRAEMAEEDRAQANDSDMSECDDLVKDDQDAYESDRYEAQTYERDIAR